MHDRWATGAAQISAILTAGNDDDQGAAVSALLPEHERPVPYDAVAAESMDDQKYVVSHVYYGVFHYIMVRLRLWRKGCMK